MQRNGSLRLSMAALWAVPLCVLAGPPAATAPVVPASATAPPRIEVVVQGEGFQVVHVEAAREDTDANQRDLCVEATGSRVLGPQPDATHRACTGHGWSFGSRDIPSDGDMGTALQQLSPVIR